MEKEQRTRLQKATQDARRLLEEEFRSQLLQTYDIDVEKVRWAEEPGAHLLAEQRLIREKLIAWIEHKQAQIQKDESEPEKKKAKNEALLLALREMAFTALNRLVALKLMEARELVRPCVSGGMESAGFLEFTAVADGLLADQESSYRLLLETIFEDVSRELRALFDPRDPASLLWPKRAALLELLDILNRPGLAELWSEDETLGWVYQYFNGDAERKKMREESAAPRNSRELAVRNQFFTPRYVVEFLTDNTLGRIWYEMRQGNTGLKDRCRYLVRRPNEVWFRPGEEPPAQPDTDETLSQEELLRQPIYIPHRPLKDPREIRMLDPACGSMHFGLYAFDLYLEIYKEAWELAQGSDDQAKQDEAFAPFVAYTAGFPDKSAFLSEVPRQILLQNVHGIDIDPRATQIARLTLWLRAQRTWQEQQVEVSARPAITRANVVCAEPMPGERELLAHFVDQQFSEAERGLLQQLLETIFDKMQLAGEAGSLLKIEEEIRDAILQAHREWQNLAVQQQDLFSAAELAAVGQAGDSATKGLQNLTKDSWINIEDRIYTALQDYANQAESRGYQQRLFAEDAAQGFAFIDTCRKRYDVTLMNPPFGEPSLEAIIYLRERYDNFNDNLYCGFFSLTSALTTANGLSGAITDRSFLTKQSFEAFRRYLVADVGPNVVVDLGWEVLDANVETCISICQKETLTSIWQDIGQCGQDKAQELLSCSRGTREWIIESLSVFLSLPFSSFAYSMPAWMRTGYQDHQNRLDAHFCRAARGMVGANADHLYRILPEISPENIGWKKSWTALQKGSPYSPFYFGLEQLLLSDARTFKSVMSYPAGRITGAEEYGKPGLAFGKRTDLMYAYIMQSDQIFSVEGQAIFPCEKSDPWQVLAVVNSSAFQFMINQVCGQHKYHGYINSLHLAAGCLPNCAHLSKLIWEKIYKLDTHNELSCYFTAPHLLLELQKEPASSLEELAERATNKAKGRHEECNQAYERINLDISNALGAQLETSAGLPDYFAILFGEACSTSLHLKGLLSYVLGCIFGRWDIRLALSIPIVASMVDPFAPLKACPPGQLVNTEGLPAAPEDIEAPYPIPISWEGILVDDPGHSLDIASLAKQVISLIWSSFGQFDIQSLEEETSQILNVPSLREWFSSPGSFFAEHLKRYSKSRRQAPIYWQLSAGNNSYSAWLYYHRFTQDTLYRVLQDFVKPRIHQAEREQLKLEAQGALSGDAATRRQEGQILLQDLRILKTELDLVAPLWNPNLNDGVIINHAILWRITAYTDWQKKCKECWEKLVKGDYDWAHLAFHLWPERVIPKCTTDRSLAIAHGLEERLWQETNNGNWLPRQLSDAELQALIAEHSKPAVKNALERFLAAPPPVGPTRTRASRSTRSTGSSAPRRPRGTAAVVDAEATRQVLLALTAAPSDGLAKAAIADLIGVEANALTAVIKQLKESGQIDQLGERRGARYVLSEQGRAAVASETEVEA